MTAKTPAERKQDERDRMRGAGFVLRQFWVHPKDWPRVQKYLALRLRKRTPVGSQQTEKEKGH